MRSALYIVVYLAVVGGGAFLLLPRWWFLWALMVLGGLVLMVSWHRGATVYQCPNCGWSILLKHTENYGQSTV